MVEKKYVQGLVSIAIPAFKRKWLREAIESALAQDYDNIELIIVDDHSPQNLREIVSPYLTNKRVSYHYNKENVGRTVLQTIGIDVLSMQKVSSLYCYVMMIF